MEEKKIYPMTIKTSCKNPTLLSAVATFMINSKIYETDTSKLAANNTRKKYILK